MIFGINTTRDISKLSQIYNNFEISPVVFIPNITTNHAITYTNVSTLNDYYKIARSFTIFSLRKCMHLYRFISQIYSDVVYFNVKSNVTKSNFFALQMSIFN